jgi:FAD:protein FMN transferase
MGTKFTIYLYAPDQASASAAFDASFDEIERVEEALSNYRETSELSRINREAGTHPVTTDPEVFQFLQASLDFSRRSDGAFDITVGPLMRAWGFFRGQGHYPTREQLAKARAHVGWRHVKLDAAARTVGFDEPGIELDPGGIGKGFAVDRVAAVLRNAGIHSALIDAGGSTIYALGAPPGHDGWTVRVPLPADRTRTLSTVSLRDTSLSTSGNYEKFFRLAGHMYCHIMDPRTGEPVQGMLQTTVIARDATTSDALSTSIFVLGPKASETLLRSSDATAALWVQGDVNAPAIAKWQWSAEVSAGSK